MLLMAVNHALRKRLCLYSRAVLLLTSLLFLASPPSTCPTTHWFFEVDSDIPWYFLHKREDNFHFIKGRTDKITLWSIGPIQIARAQQTWDSLTNPIDPDPIVK
jgi:hypothetical protein